MSDKLLTRNVLNNYCLDANFLDVTFMIFNTTVS